MAWRSRKIDGGSWIGKDGYILVKSLVYLVTLENDVHVFKWIKLANFFHLDKNFSQIKNIFEM